MYEEYYGFVQPPFSLTPDPRFLFRSESHEIALQQVWQAIRRKEGFIVLTGDIGTGKTTLCRTILEQFEPTTFTALILNPFLSVDELIREVLLHFGIVSRDAARSGALAAATKHELIRTLHDFLVSLVPIKGSAVLLIDEAQHLSPEILEELRLLSNLETSEQKLLQIVLVGQLNLLDVLHDAKLRQLDQRISIRCLLRPLNREEVEAYITHRLWVARGSNVTFTPAAFDRVLAISGGVPRAINLLCDRALMAGARAHTFTIDDAQVVEAAEALALPMPQPPRIGLPWGRPSRLVIGVAALLLSVGAFLAIVLAAGPLAFLGVDRPEVPPPDLSTVLAPPPSIGVPESRNLLTPPPSTSNAYSVIAGTFATPQEALQAERTLRARSLPVYAVDIRTAEGRRRRLLVGRYATRQEAEQVRRDLGAAFPDTRVTLEWFERVP